MTVLRPMTASHPALVDFAVVVAAAARTEQRGLPPVPVGTQPVPVLVPVLVQRAPVRAVQVTAMSKGPKSARAPGPQTRPWPEVEGPERRTHVMVQGTARVPRG